VGTASVQWDSRTRQGSPSQPTGSAAAASCSMTLLEPHGVIPIGRLTGAAVEPILLVVVSARSVWLR
jgi:hypothetical protein